MPINNLTLYTKNYSFHVLHLYGMTLDEFKLKSGFFEKIDLFEMKKIDPEPISYKGREEMVEVLRKCFKSKVKNVKPYRQFVEDHDVQVMWDNEEKWEYDFTKPINKKE